MLFIPCYEHCFLRYGKQYTKDCDDTCDYAKVIKENKLKNEIIDFLLEMLEEEHMDLRSTAIGMIKEEFGVEL